jgi:hypothetical protein
LPGAGGLPLVIQAGFAGARRIYDREQYPGIDPVRVDEAVKCGLETLMRELPAELGVKDRPYFFCGLSQLAIGGDALFTRACQKAALVQRIFLPQHWEEYLAASGSKGPDFSDAQRQTARELKALPHIIQDRVVSDATDRCHRFHDVNLELARLSDVVICLVPADAAGRPGGTQELIALARRRKRPVIEVQVRINSRTGDAVLTRLWHGKDDFRPPKIPAALAGVALPAGGAGEGPLPGIDLYCKALKNLSSKQANVERKLFKFAALVIIAVHVLATILAVIALELHDWFVAWLLGGELVALATGFCVHQSLHRTHSLERWALFRLVAEVARSITAIGRFHVYLEHLFALPFPGAVRPLLRTVNVLHLVSSRGADDEPWEPRRDAYVAKRLVNPEDKAQIPYNKATRDDAGAWLKVFRWVFVGSSFLAFVATLVKLLTLSNLLPLSHTAAAVIPPVAGALAIVLPVIAVASLSIVAAFDLEARLHTSMEMLEFLEPHKDLLATATTARDYRRLLIETESRLLGETVNWYARRSFMGVA